MRLSGFFINGLMMSGCVVVDSSCVSRDANSRSLSVLVPREMRAIEGRPLGAFMQFEQEARLLIRLNGENYETSPGGGGDGYGVVLVEKYASHSMPAEDKEQIVEQMDQALMRKQVSEWLVLGLRSDGRKFLGVYRGPGSPPPDW